MTRLFACLSLAVLLSACDFGGGSDNGLALRTPYTATTVLISDAETGAPVFDVLQMGAEISVTFEDATRFNARVRVPMAYPEGDDTDDGPVDARVSGTYTERGGVLTFTVPGEISEDTDTFFSNPGWTLSADGRRILFSETDEDVRIDVVLTRR